MPPAKCVIPVVRLESSLVVGLSFGVLFFAAYGSPVEHKGHSDFLSFYAGAKLVGTPYLYSIDHVHEMQTEFGKPAEMKAFTRPPFYAALLWPLGQLSYSRAYAVWQMLNIAALIGFVLLWSPSLITLILCCWYLPIWINFVVGQDIPIILLFVSLSALLLRRDKQFLAGLIFALCSAKFHLFLLLPVLIVAKGLWRFALGLAAGGVVLLAISIYLVGPDYLAQHVAVLRLNEAGQASQSYMPNLNGLLYGLPYYEIWLALSSFAVALATWFAIRHSAMNQAVSATLAGSLLVGLHAFLYDCGLLLPLLVTLATSIGYRKTLFLYLVVALSGAALSKPSVSFLGQLAILSLFGFFVYQTYRGHSRTEGGA